MQLEEVVDLHRYPVHDPAASMPLARELARQLAERSVAVLPEFVRAEALDREIATAEGRRIVRHVRVTTAKGL